MKIWQMSMWGGRSWIWVTGVGWQCWSQPELLNFNWILLQLCYDIFFYTHTRILKMSCSKSFSISPQAQIYSKNYAPASSRLRSGNSLSFLPLKMLILRSEIPTIWKATDWPNQPSFPRGHSSICVCACFSLFLFFLSPPFFFVCLFLW